ncbi:Uncharacterized protein FWK35_00035283, partial [Aphis craccivora]
FSISQSYGLNLKDQNELIDKMSNFILNMRVHKKQHLLPFQKGILICNKSLKNLLDDLKELHGISYILTRNLRWFILGKNLNVVFTNNTNTEQSIETNLLEENYCLTRTIITDSNLDENDQTVVADDVANLEFTAGVRQIVVPQTHLDIL